MRRPLDDFVVLSAALTGYRAAELLGTGMAETYLDRITAIIGEQFAARLWTVGRDVVQRGRRRPRHSARSAHPRGSRPRPTRASILVLWYTGQWLQLPGPWRDRHGASPLDVDHILSPDAYVAGLMWDAIGAHPQGAKAPGFATWVDLPTPSHG